MAKAAKKLPQPTPRLNDGFIHAVDELHTAKHMFECAYLAVGGSGLERDAVNAIQSVMWRAQQVLESGIAKVEAIQDRMHEAQS